MNLVLLDRSEIGEDGIAVLTDRRAAHISGVLGLQEGDRLRAGVVDGPRGRAQVLRADDSGLVLACRFDHPPSARPPVDLLLAVPRPKVLKRLYAPLAAMGVDRILLTNAAKVRREYFDTHVLQEGFARARLVEGLEQGGHTALPRVSVFRRLKPLVEDALDGLTPAALRLAAHPGEAARLLPAVRAAGPQRLLLAVGPEGGWTAFERDLLAGRGFVPVGLGPRILRTDTACVAFLALAHDALADAGSC